MPHRLFSPIRWGTEEALSDPGKFQAVDFQIVLPGYFESMRTPLIAGRTFTDADNVPGRNLVVIDQQLADKAFPHQLAVGKRILIRIRTPEAEWVDVIGVVAHQRDESLADRGREQVYFTDAFVGSGAARQWAIRTAGDPSKYGSDVRAAVKAVDSHLLITEMQPVETLLERAQAGTRFSLLLIGVFALQADCGAGTAPDGHRRRSGVDRCLRPYTRDDHHAGWRQGYGPRDFRHDGGSVLTDRSRGVLAARMACGQSRPYHSTSRGVTV